MTVIIVREMTGADRCAWAAMRKALWPETDGHEAEIDEILHGEDAWGFTLEENGVLVGFAEISIRKSANGCDSRPVPFLEGIWIDPLRRQRGLGGQLISHTEVFLRTKGFTELGSDSLIDNRDAHTAHKGWGFLETERVVYFRKLL